MKTFKIILAVFFGLSFLGNISMMIKGEFIDEWNYLALVIIGVIFFALIRSIGKEKEKDND